MAIRSFKDKVTEDINYGKSSKAVLKLLPEELHRKAQVKLARIGAATVLQDLRELRGNRLEALRGDRRGQHSIRINDQYRVCFEWNGEHAFDVEIVDITNKFLGDLQWLRLILPQYTPERYYKMSSMSLELPSPY